MKPLIPCFLALAVVLCAYPSNSQAGPLLDRIKERRAAKAEKSADKSGDTPAAGTQMLGDVAYGSDARQRLDVYLPTNPQPGVAAPVILMVHGGAWRIGDKRHDKVVDNKVARWVSKGFVLVSVNNRLLPDANPLEQAQDVAKALAFAQGKAKEWGADPAQFVLMGHSAGAHLVALLAASPTLAQQAGAQPWLGTVALDSAAMDVTTIMQAKHYGLYDPAFGTDPAFWKATSPRQQLAAGAKPLLSVCSSRRQESCDQARAFAQQGQSLGVRIEVLPQDLSHGDINQNLGLPGPYTDAVESFLASLSGPVQARLAQAKD